MSEIAPPSVHSILMPSRQTSRIVQSEMTTERISPMDLRPMRMPAQTEEKWQPVMWTSRIGRPLDCRQRLSSVPMMRQPWTKTCSQPSKSRPSPL